MSGEEYRASLKEQEAAWRARMAILYPVDSSAQQTSSSRSGTDSDTNNVEESHEELSQDSCEDELVACYNNPDLEEHWRNLYRMIPAREEQLPHPHEFWRPEYGCRKCGMRKCTGDCILHDSHPRCYNRMNGLRKKYVNI